MLLFLKCNTRSVRIDFVHLESSVGRFCYLYLVWWRSSFLLHSEFQVYCSTFCLRTSHSLLNLIYLSTYGSSHPFSLHSGQVYTPYDSWKSDLLWLYAVFWLRTAYFLFTLLYVTVTDLLLLLLSSLIINPLCWCRRLSLTISSEQTWWKIFLMQT